MRFARFGLLLLLTLSVPMSAQQTPTPPITAQTLAQAVSLMQQSLAAQSGRTPISDVTLTGTITETRNSVTKTGTIVFTVVGGEQSKITIQDSSGTRSEVRSISNGKTSAVATNVSGVSTPVPALSVTTPHPSWLFPALVLAVGASSPNYAGSDLGLEMRNGAQVHHLALWEVPPTSGAASTPNPSTLHIAQQDLYLDPTSLLPLSLTFYLHPYSKKNPNAPLIPYRHHSVAVMEEVDFSNYKQVVGGLAPFHIQVYQKNVLVYDIQLSSVAINTGAVIASAN